MAEVRRPQDKLRQEARQRAGFDRDRAALVVDRGVGDPATASRQVEDDVPRARVGLEARSDERGRGRRGQAVEERQGETRLGANEGRTSSHRDSVPCAVMIETSAVDARLVEWTPGPALVLLPEVAAARAALEAGGRSLLKVPDGRPLEGAWAWPGSTSEAEVRYGYYRLFELLERAAADASAALGPARVAAPGGRLGAAATVARWSLHGLLLPLADADLDRDPGNKEWTVRQTLGHMVQSQQFYGSFTAWWLTQAPTPAAIPPVALTYEVPSEEAQSAGSVADVRARLDALLDLAMARLGGLDSDQVAVQARWSGGEVTVGFRIGRWASHMREHTIQVEKTLVMLDRPTTEVERLVRLIFEGYGRLEQTVFGLDATDAQPAAPIFATVTEQLAELPRGIVAAAG